MAAVIQLTEQADKAGGELQLFLSEHASPSKALLTENVDRVVLRLMDLQKQVEKAIATVESFDPTPYVAVPRGKVARDSLNNPDF